MTSQNRVYANSKDLQEAIQYLRLTKKEAEVLMLAVVSIYMCYGHELNEEALNILSDFEQRIIAEDVDLWEKWGTND